MDHADGVEAEVAFQDMIQQLLRGMLPLQYERGVYRPVRAGVCKLFLLNQASQQAVVAGDVRGSGVYTAARSGEAFLESFSVF